MIKILFFDFDGTISDAKKLNLFSLVKTLDNYGYKFKTSRIRSLMGIKIPQILKILGVKKCEIDKIRKDFYDRLILGVHTLKLCNPVGPLRNLKKKYNLIVISNTESEFLKASIRKLKINDLFDEVHGAEGFSSKDRLLKKLFKKFKIKPREALYVGDRYSDIQYARKAGCWSIAIHNRCSWSTLKQIKAEKPDFIIKNFSELKKVINVINSTDNKH